MGDFDDEIISPTYSSKSVTCRMRYMRGDGCLPRANHIRAASMPIHKSPGLLSGLCHHPSPFAKKKLGHSLSQRIDTKSISCLAKMTTLSNFEQVKKDYDNCAATYNDFGTNLPYGHLESQLIKTALGDCSRLTILDLGGGTGLHAREAIDLGAATVDLVDISPGMLKVAQEFEKSLGRENVTRFFEADVSKPLSHLPLREDGYDVVMVNWIFSHAGSMEGLEGMFRNIVGYLKPGGRLIGVRDAVSRDPALENSKYGGSCKWVKNIPGGLRYLYVLHCTPPIEFEVSPLEVIYSGSTEMYERFGMSDVEVVPYKCAEVVQNDPEFWKDFLKQPTMAVFKAVKKME